MTRKEFLNATVALAASAVPVALVSASAFAAAPSWPEATREMKPFRVWGLKV